LNQIKLKLIFEHIKYNIGMKQI